MACAAACSITGNSETRQACPSIWPIGTARMVHAGALQKRGHGGLAREAKTASRAADGNGIGKPRRQINAPRLMHDPAESCAKLGHFLISLGAGA